MKIFKIAGLLTFYHGTSSVKLNFIKTNGLLNPYLCNNVELAKYYANESVEEHGGSPIILEVRVLNVSNLRYDNAAMNEPVMSDEDDRDASWEKAELEHPEWVHGDTITIPTKEWEYSLDGVGSVKYEGIIPLSDIKVF